jgi:antirestriction protein ArdC
MKRDPYAEMSTRIIAELEAGAPWVEPWSATAGMNKPCNRDQSAFTQDATSCCCGCHRRPGYPTPRFLTFKKALESGGNVRKSPHGTKVHFVKQLQVHDNEPGPSIASSQSNLHWSVAERRCGLSNLPTDAPHATIHLGGGPAFSCPTLYKIG